MAQGGSGVVTGMVDHQVGEGSGGTWMCGPECPFDDMRDCPKFEACHKYLVNPEIERLRAALQPLANVAVAIDDNASCVYSGHKRPDTATIWQANAMERGPLDLTMAHARAARRALEE